MKTKSLLLLPFLIFLMVPGYLNGQADSLDVGVTKTFPVLFIPYATMWCPQVVVRNFGLLPVDSIPVTLFYNDTYVLGTETIHALLMPGDSITWSFSNTGIMFYNQDICTKVYTTLTGDTNHANDTSAFCQFSDISITSILHPPDSLNTGLKVYPEFRAENKGTYTIYQIGYYFVYDGDTSQPEYRLAPQFPGDSADLVFQQYFTVKYGLHTLCIHAQSGTMNNVLCKDIEGINNIGINEPVGNPPVLRAAPNPATDATTLHYSGALPATIMMFDALGRQVHECTMDANQLTVSLERLKPGFYHLMVRSSQHKEMVRLMIIQ